MALEHEMGVFLANLMDLLGEDNINEGKYVVIKDDEILPVAYELEFCKVRIAPTEPRHVHRAARIG